MSENEDTVNIENEEEPTEEELLEQVQELKAANREKLEALLRMNRNLDPFGVMSARTEILIDYLFNAIPAARYQYELLFEQSMSVNLDEALKQARVDQLAVKVSDLPSNIRLK